MSLANKVATVLVFVSPIIAFIYLLSGKSTPEHPRWGTMTFPLGLMIFCLLISAALWVPDDNSMEAFYFRLISGVMLAGAIGFGLICVWVLLAGYPFLPA